uniref:CCHC-type domain-containing protein n=1 Tax=Plectus sambesii TaxID=2011161 RepID=A0A914VH67_9BILA
MEQLVELLRKQLEASQKRADEWAAAEAKLKATRVAEEAKREEKWAAAEAEWHAADFKRAEDRKAEDAALRAEYAATTQTLVARIEALSTQQLLEGTATPLHIASAQECIMQSVSQCIIEFEFDPDNDVTFENWYKRFEGTLNVDGLNLDEKSRVRLLVSKLHTTVFAKYANHILPQTPWDINFDETVNILTKLFDKPHSLFHGRYRCLTIFKDEDDDMMSYTRIVNKQCKQFKLADLTIDQFKCLMFACGLQSTADANVRIKILHQMEINPELTLHKAGQLCMQYKKLTADSQMTQGNVGVKAIEYQTKEPQLKPGRGEASDLLPMEVLGLKPLVACWNCGKEGHFNANCPFKNNKCCECDVVGHKDGQCFDKGKFRPQVTQIIISGMETVQEAERNYAEVVIHGVEVKLLADSGSDSTIITHEDWTKMGKPTLTPCPDASAVNGSSIKLYGCFDTKFCCTLAPRSGSGMCYISEDIRLMGRSWLNQAIPEYLQSLMLICAPVKRKHESENEKKSTIAELQGERPVNKLKRGIPKLRGEGTPAKILQKEPRQGQQGTAMQSQSNRQHGARMHRFAIGDLVYMYDNRTPSKPGWTPGQVIKRTGQDFIVDVDGTSNVCDANQLKPRLERDNLPPPDARQSSAIRDAHQTPTPPPPPLRRSTRIIHKPRKLDLDLRKASYRP